jgi:hypothetical protein
MRDMSAGRLSGLAVSIRKPSIAQALAFLVLGVRIALEFCFDKGSQPAICLIE